MTQKERREIVIPLDYGSPGKRREIVIPLEPAGPAVRRRLTQAQQKDYVMRAGKCMVCGETDIRVLDVHHIKPFAKGGRNSPSKLSVLCPNCHRKAQKGLINAPSFSQKLAEKAKTGKSKASRRTRATKPLLYCRRCGEIPGSRSICIGLSTSHDFVSGREVIYCRRCGQKVGVRSECIGLSTSHDFISGKNSDVCSRCGVSVGRRSECTGLTTSHNFVPR